MRGDTGSGKTGSAWRSSKKQRSTVCRRSSSIPNTSAIAVDVPNLASEDFAPWVNEDDARRKTERSRVRRRPAALWKKGLASWGQDGARIARLKNAAEFTIYTPGSTAGVPLSIIKSFAAPDRSIATDAELLRDRIQTTATSLLGLVGVDADPIRSREHILLSTILQSAWTEGRDLTLPDIIQQIQTPPVTRVGVMDLDAFFAANDRFAGDVAQQPAGGTRF
jgi:hypothetical protein